METLTLTKDQLKIVIALTGMTEVDVAMRKTFDFLESKGILMDDQEKVIEFFTDEIFGRLSTDESLSEVLEISEGYIFNKDHEKNQKR